MTSCPSGKTAMRLWTLNEGRADAPRPAAPTDGCREARLAWSPATNVDTTPMASALATYQYIQRRQLTWGAGTPDGAGAAW